MTGGIDNCATRPLWTDEHRDSQLMMLHRDRMSEYADWWTVVRACVQWRRQGGEGEASPMGGRPKIM